MCGEREGGGAASPVVRMGYVNTEGRSVHVGCWCKNRLVRLEYEWIVSFVSYHISLYHISLYRVSQCTITFATTM